jgi:hypothetical protein
MIDTIRVSDGLENAVHCSCRQTLTDRQLKTAEVLLGSSFIANNPPHSPTAVAWGDKSSSRLLVLRFPTDPAGLLLSPFLRLIFKNTGSF